MINRSPAAAAARSGLALLAAVTVALSSNFVFAAPPAAPSPAPPPAPAPAPQTPAADKPAQADLPDGKKVIDDCLQAMGGADKLKEIKSYSLKTKLATPMGDIQFHLQTIRNGTFYLLQTPPDKPETIVVFDGKEGWMKDPDKGLELFDERSTKGARQQINMVFPFWHVLAPHEHYETFQTVERAPFHDVDCYKVRMTGPEDSGLERFGHFEVESKMPRGVTIVNQTFSGPIEVEFYFEDWKQYDAIKAFNKLTISQLGQFFTAEYTDVEFNKVDPAVLNQPEEVKDLIKKREEAKAKPPEAPAAPATPAPAPDAPSTPPAPAPQPSPH